DDSVGYARSRLGWTTHRCRDFVDQPFLAQLGVGPKRPDDRTLGVALRQWPGLDVDTAALQIDRVAQRAEVDSVRLYVAEAPSRGPDMPFNLAVLRRLKTPRATIRPYSSAELTDFVTDMARCSVAVSMKLHSNAIWAATRVPIYPILYAPK